MTECAAGKMKDVSKVMGGMRCLSNKHVSSYSLKGACVAYKVLCYVSRCATYMIGCLLRIFC